MFVDYAIQAQKFYLVIFQFSLDNEKNFIGRQIEHIFW